MRALSFCVLAVCASVAFAAFNPPNWTQCDPKWADIRIANKSGTVCSQGATETCYAMLMATRNYTGDPGTLVQWLNANGGYKCYPLVGCNVLPETIDKLGFTKYYEIIEFASHSLVMSYVNKGFGVLAEVTTCGKGHFVLITGEQGNGYTVRDPLGCALAISHGEAEEFLIIQ